MTQTVKGTRVRLIHTSDPYTRLQGGTEGTVALVDDIGTIHVNWDDGSSLALVRGYDSWEVLTGPSTTGEVTITAEELAGLIWENYYCLGVTRAEAMAVIWGEVAEGYIYPWVREEHGATFATLSEALSILTRAVTGANWNTPATTIGGRHHVGR